MIMADISDRSTQLYACYLVALSCGMLEPKKLMPDNSQASLELGFCM